MLDNTPSIYVVSLSDYNAGFIHGEWIDATQGYDLVMKEIKKMLERSPVTAKTGEIMEEWAIHDYDGFLGVKIDEYESIKNVCMLAELLEEYGEPFAMWFDDQYSISEIENINIENFKEDYQGEWPDLATYAQDLVNECYSIPDFLNNFINWDKFANALEAVDYWCDVLENSNVAVFRKC